MFVTTVMCTINYINFSMFEVDKRLSSRIRSVDIDAGKLTFWQNVIYVADPARLCAAASRTIDDVSRQLAAYASPYLSRFFFLCP